MINIIALFFTAEFSSEYEPFQLLLGAGIGIIAILILIKKIINKRNQK
jgi:multisubunit Na+/H+ antiporter MnhE subunit